MGKWTISMAMFNSYATNYQRVGSVLAPRWAKDFPRGKNDVWSWSGETCRSMLQHLRQYHVVPLSKSGSIPIESARLLWDEHPYKSISILVVLMWTTVTTGPNFRGFDILMAFLKSHPHISTQAYLEDWKEAAWALDPPWIKLCSVRFPLDTRDHKNHRSSICIVYLLDVN